MSFPSSPPIRHTPRPWSFPAASRSRLPWGLDLVVVRVASLPLVQVRWTFGAGRTQEDAARVGASRLLSTVMRHGTATMDSAALANALDHLGARLRVSVGQDQANVSVAALAWHADEALHLADEVAFRPTLPSDDLNRERASALELHEHERSQAEQIAAVWLSWSLYAGHPYGDPPATVAGLRDSVRDELLALHRRIFQPARAQLAVVGDVDPETLLARLEARYASPPTEGDPGALRVLKPVGAGGPRRVWAIERPEAEQVAVAVGQLLFPRAHPDYLPMRLVNQVFGAGSSSRLFLELRERRSLTYGAYSAVDCSAAGGDFAASLSTSAGKAREAVGALLTEIERARAEPIGEDELEPARRNLIGSFPQRASGVGGVAGLLGYGWVHGLPDDAWSRYPVDVSQVDAARASEVAARWLSAQRATVVVAGTREAIDEAVADLPEIERGLAEAPPYDPR